MKIILPEDISEITLRVFQDYSELLDRKDLTEFQFDKRKIAVFTDLRYRDCNNISQKDFKDILKQIDKALNVDKPFIQRFKMNVEYGFIPNFDKMTTKEFVDLSLYPVENVEDLHKLMAILFRPVTKKSFNNYDIETYNGTEKHAETMKGMPMNVVHGSLVFFWNLSEILLQSIHQSTMGQEQKKDQEQQTSFLNGDGMQLLRN